MTIFTQAGLSLRLVEKKDLSTLLLLRNDPSTWSQLTDPLPITERDQSIWMSSISLRTGRFYAVACNPTNSFIGLVRMDLHDPQNRNIRVGLDVLSGLRGRGYGFRIYGTILSYCFRELNVHRVWLQVVHTNKRAQRLYGKLGFREEGRMRDAVFRGGRYIDYVMMSILEDEYESAVVQGPCVP